MIAANPADDFLCDLVGRLGAAEGAAIQFSAEAIRALPESVVDRFTRHKLLRRATPATAVGCDGCEEHCTMSVHGIDDKEDSSPFIFCDRREDTARVPVAPWRLARWQTTGGMLAQAVAKSLGILDGVRRDTEHGHCWRLGAIKGKTQVETLILRFDRTVTLDIGDHALPLLSVLSVGDGRLQIDQNLVIAAIDRAGQEPPDNPHYRPTTERREERRQATQARHARWNAEYLRLRRVHRDKDDVWIAREIAKLPVADGRSAETIRKNMKFR